MHIVKSTSLPQLNVGNTAHARVQGIGIELKAIVHHTVAQDGKGIEVFHPLTLGVKGMNANHPLVRIQEKGGGTADLLQGIFTQTRGIIDHKHDRLQNPETLTVTNIPEVMQWILCTANVTTDQDHLLKTLAQMKYVMDHDPNHH